MKRIAARLKKLTQSILNETCSSPEEYKAYQEELKTLRELIATHKAYEAYKEDYGVIDDDDDEEATSSKRQRVSGASFA